MNAQWFEITGKMHVPSASPLRRQSVSMNCRVLVIGGRIAASGHGELTLGELWSASQVFLEEIGWTVRELSENEP